MATEWRFKAEYMKNCNCAPGCPCDFWAAPTHYKCEGMMAFRILEGKFGNTRLDGVIAGAHITGRVHCIWAMAYSSRIFPTRRLPSNAKLF